LVGWLQTVIQRSIEIDQRHGLSERFKSWFLTLIGQGKAIDEKTRATERAQSLASTVDAKTGAQEKAKQAYSVGRGASPWLFSRFLTPSVC
jgi:hypothetical protein